MDTKEKENAATEANQLQKHDDLMKKLLMSDKIEQDIPMTNLNLEAYSDKLTSNGILDEKKLECLLKKEGLIDAAANNNSKQNEAEKKSKGFISLENLNHLKGYLFGLLFAISSCMTNIFVKMSPSLDGSNHAASRYLVQIIVMLIFIKVNKLEMFGPKNQRKLLFVRGFVGCSAVIIGFFSIRYLDVSDVETLTNSCVLITALLSRIFLKEKLTVCHIIALFLTLAGVLFIIRPTFLFGIEENLEGLFHVNLTMHNLLIKNQTFQNLNVTGHKYIEIKDHLNRNLIESIIGVALVLISASCMSVCQVVIRKLCLCKVHFSITSFYPAFIGLPSSIIISLILIFTKSSHRDMEEETFILPIQIFYSFCGACFGTIALIFLNNALRYEDATKIGMVKTMGVFFSFIMQYLILDIEVDFLGILGAIFVVSATFLIMTIKLTEKSLVKSDNCLKFLAIKF